jgi:hypothetical protein
VLQENWHEDYSGLFAFQIQGLVPTSPYCVVHIVPNMKRKGNGETINRLVELKASLEVGCEGDSFDDH